MDEVKGNGVEVASTEGVPAPAESTSEETSHVTIPVESYLPDDTPTYYSDGMLVLHSANEFILSFLQTHYPLAGSKEELQQVKLVKRKCVAQIIMSPAQFEVVITALQDNLQKYQNAYRKPQTE